jgi:CxxC-x17-CxxC domain-containing protein
MKSKRSLAPRVDPYLEGLVAKLLERLIGLEKKLDVVIAQTGEKPFMSPEAKQPPRRERVFYEAICADCHKVCEVPFKPSEDRPVYCKECFAKRKTPRPVQPAQKPRDRRDVPETKNRPAKKAKKKK